MLLQIDTRQQKGKHKLKHEYFESLGIKTVNSKLLVGDYSVASDGSVSVDTKKDIAELYSCLVSSHDRFRSECELAQEAGIKLYILVENKDGITTLSELGGDKWKNPQWFRYWKAKRSGVVPKPPVSNVTLMKIAWTMQEKYGVEFVFCSPEEAGAKVLELLDVDLDKSNSNS